ncbi:hypothetical protein C1645_741935 [Glomus cerebriforme]|uniref:BED-type domain-containing protein n=1 Tax=Glomus cerebriforme TaxID=658196 RepID=A0A397SG35_9GLOM|nr:hypothetical protein C1645_741935 [Glomus cerebriforme]
MPKLPRKKKPVWDHFCITGKNDDPHPSVRCNHCSKEYKRAVPGRMQDHLDKKCSVAPDIAKSQSRQQNTTSTVDRSGNHMSYEQQRSFEILLVQALISTQTDHSFVDDPNVIELFRLLRPSFKLPNREELRMQMDYYSNQTSGLEYRHQQTIYHETVTPIMSSSEGLLDPNREISIFQRSAQSGEVYDLYLNYPNLDNTYEN